MLKNECADVSPAEEYFRATLRYAQFRLIQKEIPPQETGEKNDALDECVLRRIDSRFRELRRKTKRKKNAVSILKTVSVILLIANLCMTAAFAVSGVLRERILKLFVTTYPTHSDVEITDGSVDSQNTAPAAFPEYTVGWFPNNRFIVTEKYDTPDIKSITYTNGTGMFISLDVNSENALSSVNTEGMAEKAVRVGGKDLRVFHTDGKSFVIWQEGSLCFILSSMGLSEAEAVLAAVSVTAVDDPGTGAYGIQ